jgi:mechanosensitive ion channel protein 1/2/3
LQLHDLPPCRYRTTIRSFEREVFIIPNSTFSKTVILNVTRKKNEWRFLDNMYVECKNNGDFKKLDLALQEMRAIVRKDPRVIQKLHK